MDEKYGSMHMYDRELKEKIEKLNEKIEKYKESFEKKHKRPNKMTLTIGICFLVVMVVIIIVSAIFIEHKDDVKFSFVSADYLAAVVPLLIAIGGFFVAFLGMNRLKSFDEEIKSIRVELDKRVEEQAKKEVILSQEALLTAFGEKKEEAEKSLEGIVEEFKGNIDNEVENGIDEITKLRDSLESKLQGEIKATKDSIKDFTEKYSWLAKLTKEDLQRIDFHTVEEAHKLAEKLHEEKPNGYVTMIKNIAVRVCEKEDLSGDSADYHNLAAELARGSMYNESCDVLEKGLETFEKDVDLLSDYIEYAVKAGKYGDAESKVKVLNTKTDHRLWTWRCYEFQIDYYRAIGDVNMADRVCDKFIEAMPSYEKAYASKAEIAKQLKPGKAGRDDSIRILENAIKKNIICPQCANALAEEYMGIGEYEKALWAADRAVQELAQEQPNINVAYVFYNRAIIKDRLFMRAINEKGRNNIDDNTRLLADEAYSDYKMALEFELSIITSKQAQRRQKILEPYLSEAIEIDDVDKPNEERTRTLLALFDKFLEAKGLDMNEFLGFISE